MLPGPFRPELTGLAARERVDCEKRGNRETETRHDLHGRQLVAPGKFDGGVGEDPQRKARDARMDRLKLRE